MNKALRAYLRLLAAFTLLAAIGQLAFPDSLFNAILAVLNYARVAFGLAALRLAMIKKRSNPT